jgi:hypothetical protein
MHSLAVRAFTATAVLAALSPLASGQAHILIDSFTDGSSFTLQNTSGTAAYNLTSGPDIIGGSRQIRVRAAGSGFYGPADIRVDVTAGTLASYGTDNSDRMAQYGTAIGSDTFTGAGPGTPVQLNLNLNLADTIQFDVTHVPVNNPAATSFNVLLFGGSGATYLYSAAIAGAGTYSVALSAFSGLTEGAANDIDGFRFGFQSNTASLSDALVVGELRIEVSAIPEPSTYAAIAGAAVLGFAAWRRRHSRAHLAAILAS